MTYQEIVEKVRKHYRNATADKIQGHLAVQFNITGEGHGAFYLEVADSKVNIEPYEYYNRDAAMNLTAATLFRILNKETTLENELNDFHITVEGQIGAVLILKDIQTGFDKEIPEAEKKAVKEVEKVKEEIDEIIAAEVLKAEAEAMMLVAENKKK
ncbi:MAG: SCP-2 sterol transfer family protein [Lachnospiraceae bacterium]|nr:SCP-2 sterol transfer family protein [Lachnospiraceae bacterium]